MSDVQGGYKRSKRLLFRKMIEYLFPAMLTTAALSLNEFVDSMMVSRMLGSRAMAIVGLGSPVMLCYAALYTLLGNGGATLYALNLGKRDTATAGKAFHFSIIAALSVSLLLIALGFICFDKLTSMLCSDTALLGDFRPYLRALIFSAPIIIPIMTLTEFLPPSGAPKYATAINVVANGVNLLMDYVYIKIFGMGVVGAAWATLTGYVVSIFLVAYVVMRRKAQIHHCRTKRGDIGIFGSMIGSGSPPALSQLGFALKYAFCNSQAMLYGGSVGVVAYSLCNQTISIISIFLAALAGAAMPLIAVLHGQRDYRGESIMMKMIMIANAVIAVVCFAAFVIFAEPLAKLYNITAGAELELAVKAVRIFSIMFLFRGFYMIFMKYMQVTGYKLYSMFISIFDGFGGIIPIAFVMGKLMRLNGLWWTFPVTSIILLGILLVWNKRMVRRSEGKLKTVLLAPVEDEAKAVFDVTILEDAGSISEASKALMDFCIAGGVDRRRATHAALTLEEMAIYTRNRMGKDDYMDILARLYPGKIEIDYRTLGNSFDPLASAPDDISENIRLLRGIASKLEYDYIMGMNCTRIEIVCNEGV